MFCARRGTVERLVGRIIHLMTREMVSGFKGVDERVWRNVGRGSRRERRWIVQSGIFFSFETSGMFELWLWGIGNYVGVYSI